MEWMLILGYICFALGGVLLIIGFTRLIWWGLYGRKKNPPAPKRETSPNFQAYYKDPWLRAPSMASIISRHKDQDVDSLRVDTDDIYALPADNNTRGIYLQSTPPTEHELSQTESQIYAEGSGSGRDGTDGIYSVPNKVNKGSREAVIDEEDDSMSGHAPAIPGRYYLDVDHNGTDGGSLTEADRSHMREIGYLDPPVDYSPERRVPHLSSEIDHAERVTTYFHNGRLMTSSSQQQRSNGTASGSGVDELSSNGLYQTTVFTDGYEDVRHGQSSAGSVKSMKSLYKYMYTDEPCALDKEVDITFTSSVH